MARAGTLIGISYRLAVYQQTEADPLPLFGNNRLLSNKSLESRLFRRIDQSRSTNSRFWFQKLEKIRSTLTRGIEILTNRKGRHKNRERATDTLGGLFDGIFRCSDSLGSAAVRSSNYSLSDS
jgi:hypothetical protein